MPDGTRGDKCKWDIISEQNWSCKCGEDSDNIFEEWSDSKPGKCLQFQCITDLSGSCVLVSRSSSVCSGSFGMEILFLEHVKFPWCCLELSGHLSQRTYCIECVEWWNVEVFFMCDRLGLSLHMKANEHILWITWHEMGLYVNSSTRRLRYSAKINDFQYLYQSMSEWVMFRVAHVINNMVIPWSNCQLFVFTGCKCGFLSRSRKGLHNSVLCEEQWTSGMIIL